MPAVPMPVVTPRPRAAWQSLVAAFAAWSARPSSARVAELPPLDDRQLRDIGLSAWAHQGVGGSHRSHALERIAHGLPAEWSR